MEELLKKISQKIKKERDLQAFKDMKDVCLSLDDKELQKKYLLFLSDEIENAIKESNDDDFVRELYILHREVCFAGGRLGIFHLYLLALEWNREPKRKFYPPRRKVLRPLVDDLQDLLDDKIDFLGISLAPRVGKSTLCIFFMTLAMSLRPNDANVMSGHSDKLTEPFYRELLSIFTDEQYCWQEIFPDVTIKNTSAKNETIDLNTSKRFPTITCRSVSGTLTGAVEIGEGGILYCDDLIEDLEEAINPLRLDAKYDAYLNQLKDRKKDGAKELMVGTRWNVGDPLGRIQAQYEGNPRYRFRVIPALDENDESNFQYGYGVGFSTKYYHDVRDSIDDATWWAKYMGQPYVREGLLFPKDELRYYNGNLPEGDHEIVACCDVAWGGGDSTSMPIAYIYGDNVYIADLVFNNGDKTITRPEVIGKIAHHLPNRARFEANNGGDEYADKVDEELRKRNVHTNIFSVKSPPTKSKMARIIQYAPDIKNFYFLAPKYQSSEYRKAMEELTMFTQTGKNVHDDFPDSLAMLADEVAKGSTKITVFQRPF